MRLRPKNARTAAAQIPKRSCPWLHQLAYQTSLAQVAPQVAARAAALLEVKQYWLRVSRKSCVIG